MLGGTGDYFQTQVNYTQGALRYVFQTTQPNWGFNEAATVRALVLSADAVYGGVITGTGLAAATSLELTTAWNVNAAYEHFWSPRWRTSLYGGYAKVEYGGGYELQPRYACSGTTGLVTNGCNGLEHLVGRFADAVEHHQGLLHGLDVMYSKLKSANFGPDGQL